MLVYGKPDGVDRQHQIEKVCGDGLVQQPELQQHCWYCTLFLGTKKDALVDTGDAFDVTWDMFILLQLQSHLLEIIADPADTVHMGKGA